MVYPELVFTYAHRTTTIDLIDPSKLARFPSPGGAPMLVYVRPSNEALLRSRVPGAQDQRGCPSNPFHRGAPRARRAPGRSLSPLPSLPISLFGGRPGRSSTAHVAIESHEAGSEFREPGRSPPANDKMRGTNDVVQERMAEGSVRSSCLPQAAARTFTVRRTCAPSRASMSISASVLNKSIRPRRRSLTRG